MKNRDKMSKINLIMSVISLDIVIVIICFNLGKIYLTIILGIGIIIELNLLIRYLTERNLTEKRNFLETNHQLMGVRIVFVIFKKTIMTL